MVFTIKATDEFDDITAGIASGKAVPDIFGKTDNKGVGIVAAMNWTGAEESIASCFKLCHRAIGFKYLRDGDAALEEYKVKMLRDHLAI